VKRVFLTESAVLVHLKPVRVILFILHRVIIALFALSAGQSYFHSHNGTSRNTEKFLAPNLRSCGLPQGKRMQKNNPIYRGKIIVTHRFTSVKLYFQKCECPINTASVFGTEAVSLSKKSSESWAFSL
jgi:hypothetical protein